MSKTGTAFILANRDLEENQVPFNPYWGKPRLQDPNYMAAKKAEHQLPPIGPYLVRIAILEEALENILAADDLQEAIGVAQDALDASQPPEDPDE